MLDQNGVLKSGKIFIISLVITTLFLALFVLGSGQDAKNLILNSPAASNIDRVVNLTGFIVLNMTIQFHPVTFVNASNITNVTFIFVNASGFPVLNVTNTTLFNHTNETGHQVSFDNLSFDTRFLPDGNYTINITAYNTTYTATGLGYASNASYIVRIDNTPPSVTSLILGNISGYDTMTSLYGFNFTPNLAKENYTIRAVINDTTLTVQSVLFNISNATGRIINFTGILNGSNYSAFNFNLSSFSEGLYNLTVVANDTVNNTNRTVYLPFAIDGTAPLVLSAWYNATNNSQFNSTAVSIIYFNATVNDTTLSTQEVRFGFYNNINSTGFNVTAVKNAAGTWTANVTASSMIDGVYTVEVIGNDTLNNVNKTANLTFTLDRSAPNVSLTADSPVGTNLTGANFSLHSSNQTFNVSMRDLVGVSSVYFVFENVSGTDFNISATNKSGDWSVSYNVSQLAEGNHVVRIFTNDTLGNINTTQNYTFTVDTVNPVISASTSDVTSTVATLKASINESVVSCIYSVTNGGGNGNLTRGTGGTSFTASLTLLPSTDYTATVTCTDFVGNPDTDTTTFTSSAAASTSNGGGGAGGSSGGVSSAVQGQLAKETWSSINAGETAKVEVPNGAVGVTEVSFTVPQTVYGAWVQVAKKDKLPSSVSSFEGKVYKNLEISKGPALNKEGSFTDATVKFKVEKAWLADNKLTTESVALFHYADNKWNKLQTQVGEDDGTYVHYSAKTPGFSYFVIGQSEQAAPAVEAPAAQPAAPSEQQAAPAEAPAMEKKGLSTGTVAALVVAALVVVALVWYFRKRR